jgi:hypothetical protein
VRVRVIELRILAVAMTGLWVGAFGMILLGYRPGGPIDLLVGATAGLPILVALAAIAWPPVARGDRAFRAIAWLGLGTLLLLVPSIAGVLAQIQASGTQTLLPSVEAVYPWVLALAGTCLFAGLGIARQQLGETALRRRRLIRGTALALGMLLLVGSPFAGAAVANELALRDRPVADSRFGPTDPELALPACTDELVAGPTARLQVRLDADIDDRPTGVVTLDGIRDGTAFRWLGFAAGPVTIGQRGMARVGESAYSLAPGTGWVPVPFDRAEGQDLDLQVMRAALTPELRAIAEERGVAFFEGARARHCRIAVDGAILREAVPQISLLVGDADISRWMGELDYWVFADGQLGRVVGRVNGAAIDLGEEALLATIRVRISAVDRDIPHIVSRPPR